jgi:hypothetical protein
MEKRKRKRIKIKKMPDFNSYTKTALVDYVANPVDPHYQELAQAHLDYRNALETYANAILAKATAGIGSNPIGNPPPPPGS